MCRQELSGTFSYCIGKNMRYKRNILLMCLFVIVLAIILVVSYPSFLVLKPYARSGGFWGSSQDKICQCVGLSYSHYPRGCTDCYQTFYCLGLLHNCKCLDEGKAKEYYETYNKSEFTGDYWDGFQEHAYSECN